MKRWTLLLAGAALWLFLAAVPALADGGPHVAAANSGVSTLTADSCAGCHRAHTAQGAMLINAPSEEELCLTCHGATSQGATTDVMTGVQYVAADGLRDGGTQLGALRNGGFDQARIDAGNVQRAAYQRTDTDVGQHPKVGVGTAEDVTSAHIALTENGLTLPGVAWGNGANGSGAGPTVTGLSCANCHNVHGNGQYRILNPIPEADGAGFVAVVDEAAVTDAALPPAGDTRNYTVIQYRDTDLTTTPPTVVPYLLASEIVADAVDPAAGDYFHRTVPWDPSLTNAACDTTVSGTPNCVTANDAPNGLPATFNVELNAWCSTCHTRYHTGNVSSYEVPRPDDDIFTYQHPTRNRGAAVCSTCHVAHGSNASMAADPVTGTTFSQNATYPNDTVSASSRLLKIDRRGTCQACHDPTGTINAGEVMNPGGLPLTVP